MSKKRFTDVELWDKVWFSNLKLEEKLFFFYLKDKCDNVGVWTPNFPLAEFHIKSSVDWESLPEKVNNNIEILECGKWWIVDFCRFQFGKLMENPTGGNNPALRSYVKLLSEHGLYERFLDNHGLRSVLKEVLKGSKEKEEEKEVVKEEQKEVEIVKNRNKDDRSTSGGSVGSSDAHSYSGIGVSPSTGLTGLDGRPITDDKIPF